jgi:hypothetical protein
MQDNNRKNIENNEIIKQLYRFCCMGCCVPLFLLAFLALGIAGSVLIGININNGSSISGYIAITFVGFLLFIALVIYVCIICIKDKWFTY